MRVFICLMLAALLSGCLPIGVRGSSVPFRAADVRTQPIAAAMGVGVAGRMNSALQGNAVALP